MRDVIIKQRKETVVTDEALYDLAEESYQQWNQQGIVFPSLYRSFASFQCIVNLAQVFVALDAKSGELLGLHIFRPYRRKKYAYGFYLAVSPKAKRQGVASQMLCYEEEFIRYKGYRYLIGTTIPEGVWSVRWHLKNGYRIIGYKQSPESKYAIYVFRKQLAPASLRHPFYSLYNYSLFCRCCYYVSYITTCLIRHSDGRLNLVGRVARRKPII